MKKGKFVTFRLKTPHTTLKTNYYDKAAEILAEETSKRSVKIIMPNLTNSLKVAINRSISIASIFFQRVCSRTPMDADYSFTIVGKDGETHTITHKADDRQCRLDWFLECNNKKITARELAEQKEDIFDKYNDKESIDFIKDILIERFKDDMLNGDININIGNLNPYFATLEYGGYDKDSATKYDKGRRPHGIDNKHGIKNLHSVQAPVGMLRITQMELASLAQTAYKTPLATRFRRQATERDLSDEKLKSLLAKFKASKRLPLKDIKGYLGL